MFRKGHCSDIWLSLLHIYYKSPPRMQNKYLFFRKYDKFHSFKYSDLDNPIILKFFPILHSKENALDSQHHQQIIILGRGHECIQQGLLKFVDYISLPNLEGWRDFALIVEVGLACRVLHLAGFLNLWWGCWKADHVDDWNPYWYFCWDWTWNNDALTAYEDRKDTAKSQH